jgi:hypothetical protein
MLRSVTIVSVLEHKYCHHACFKRKMQAAYLSLQLQRSTDIHWEEHGKLAGFWRKQQLTWLISSFFNEPNFSHNVTSSLKFKYMTQVEGRDDRTTVFTSRGASDANISTPRMRLSSSWRSPMVTKAYFFIILDTPPRPDQVKSSRLYRHTGTLHWWCSALIQNRTRTWTARPKESKRQEWTPLQPPV